MTETLQEQHARIMRDVHERAQAWHGDKRQAQSICLLYTSDAADE